MSSTMNDTMKTAIHGVESIREGTEHTFASTLGTLVKGVNAVSGVVAMLRSLDRDDGLAWFGLARRNPLRSAATFSAGLTLGAGLGLLFAPTSGAEMRRTFLGRFTKQPPVGDATTPPRPAVVPAAPIPAEHDVGFGASHGYDSTHGGPTGPGDAPAKIAKSAAVDNHGPAGHHGSA
jgi:hypothetical protein